jgi:hypothetical protein
MGYTTPAFRVTISYHSEKAGEPQVDHFKEEIIVKKNRGLNTLVYFLVNIMMVVLALAAAISLNSIFSPDGTINIMSIVMTLVLGGLAALCFLFRGRLRIEYEYSFTNGTVDIDMVINNSQRKRLLSFNIRNVDIMAPVPSQDFNRYDTMPNVRRINAFLNRNAPKYFLYYRTDDQKNLVVIEPSREMAELMKQYNPSKVKLTEAGS